MSTMSMKKMWKISFVPYYLVGRLRWRVPSWNEAIEVLSREGYDGVEWMLGHNFNSASELKKLVNQTRRESNLEISNIMCWQDLVQSNARKRNGSVRLLKEMLVSAGELSIPIMNIFTGPVAWNPKFERVGGEISEGKAWSVVVDALSDIVDAAEKAHVIVTLEAVFGMLVHDYYTMRELLSYIDSKYLAVNLDPSHLALYGNDPAWAVRRFAGKVKHVHVKDAFGKPGVLGETFSFPFLGEGVIDWKDFFKALREVGYDGFLSIEFENDSYLKNVCSGDWAFAARQGKERIQKFLSDSFS